MVSTTTATPGAASRKRGMAGTVASPGMLRSRTATRGRSARVALRAESTSPASATTERPGSASSTIRSPLRTIVWSSASTISMSPEATPATVPAASALLDDRVPDALRDVDDGLADAAQQQVARRARPPQLPQLRHDQREQGQREGGGPLPGRQAAGAEALADRMQDEHRKRDRG